MAILGYDLSPLKDSIGQAMSALRDTTQQVQQAGPDFAGYLRSLAQPDQGGGAALQSLYQVGYGGNPAAGGDAWNTLYQAATAGASGGFGSGDAWRNLGSYAGYLAQAHAPGGIGTGAAAVAQVATPSAGLAPGVTKWAGQAQQTFGDLGADMPDTMLAIMANESGGDPNAYNAAGNAYGLFQQVGLGSYDAGTQFAEARKLAEQKLAAIQQAYAAHGLSPDARTRARDFALAWAGHFDYATGLPNPASRDIGSGQTAEQLAAIFLGNYDRIKSGRQSPGASGGGIAATAQSLIGTPYQMGGLRSHPNAPTQGLDCSEFTAWVWGQHGVTLPWNAQQQYNQTARVDPGQLQEGDLVFFHGTDPADPDYITHVGVYIGGGRMVNAQDGGVLVADLGSPYWQQHLAGYGRVSAPAPNGANRN